MLNANFLSPSTTLGVTVTHSNLKKGSALNRQLIFERRALQYKI